MVCIYALWPREPSGGGLPRSASKSQEAQKLNRIDRFITSDT